MPTQETWFDDSVIQAVWEEPLTSNELKACFALLESWIDKSERTINILFNIQNSGSIPTNAPMLAVHSGFLSKLNTGKVVVVGMKTLPQIMARVAASVSRKDINFFPDLEAAIAFLEAERERAAQQ